MLRAQGSHNAALAASTVLGAKDAAGSRRQSLPSWYTRVEGDGKEHRKLYYNIIHSSNRGMPEDDGRVGCRVGSISSQISDEWEMIASFHHAVEPDHQFSPIILVIDADDDPCLSQAAFKVSYR